MNIIDFYQSGGFTLPQVSAGVPTINPIGSEFAIQNYGKNTQESFNNYLQGEQLILQKSSNAMQTIDSINRQRQLKIQNAIAQQVQERQMKMYDLQNKRFEQEVMSNNQLQFQKLLDMDNDLFLEADNDRIQKSMVADKIDDQSLNDTIDFRDSDAIYAAQRKRSARLSEYKDAYTNKKQYSDAIARINDPKAEATIDRAAKAGYLDVDQFKEYSQSVINLQRKLEDFRYKGAKIDWTTDEDWLKVQGSRNFISEKLFNDGVNAANQRQQALAFDNNASAFKKQMDSLDEISVYNSVLGPNKQIAPDGSNFSEIAKTLTQEDYKKIEDAKQKQLTDKELRKYKSDLELYEAKQRIAAKYKTAAESSTTVDTNGHPYIKRGNNKDYGTFSVNDAGTGITSMTVNGQTINPRQYLESAKKEGIVMNIQYTRQPGVAPHAYFTIDVSADNEEIVTQWLLSHGLGYGSDDLTKIMTQHPYITRDGDKLKIKGDDSTLVASTPSNSNPNTPSGSPGTPGGTIQTTNPSAYD